MEAQTERTLSLRGSEHAAAGARIGGVRMFTAYIVVTVVAAAVNTYAAYVEFTHADWIVANINRYGVPESWLFLLGVLKATAAAGFLVGIGESMTSGSPTVL
jgi:hypothetical protein